MRDTKNVGRTVGALFLVHLIAGLMLPYILLNRVITSPGFLESAAGNAIYVRVPVLLLLLGGAIALGISIVAYPVLRQHNDRLAICLLALGIANFPLQAIEGGMLLSMLSLSQEFSAAGGRDALMLQAVGIAVGAGRRWAHFTQLLTIVSWIFVLFASLWRAGLIPRVLGILGLITCVLQVTGVPLRAILGYPLMMEMAMPLAPASFGLALWLIVKGFGEGRRENREVRTV